MKTLIDLFAGCGGLSLGLEQAGFTPVYVNELHPDALATYLVNRSNSPVSLKANQSQDITTITGNPKELAALSKRLNLKYGDIDLVAGGPPCQGFSGIGHRRSFEVTKEEMPTNHLYHDMAKFIQAVGPKVFVFENVRGLLNARWNPDGAKGEIWSDVLQSFQSIRTKKLSYKIYWELVFAKDFGVPQNRPRIILIGVRQDISDYKESDMKKLFDSRRFQSLPPDPIDLLGDLVDENWIPGGSTSKYPMAAKSNIQRLLRIDPRSGLVFKKGSAVTDHDYAKHSIEVTKKFAHMIENEGSIPESMKTKKFAQRLIPETWGPRGPFITATSLTDDYVHFSQPRVLTVREWARLQTFPDWYAFTGKRTTGGRRRAGDPSIGIWTRDLPKYTQIGNAVPVKLAFEVGRIVSEIIGRD